MCVLRVCVCVLRVCVCVCVCVCLSIPIDGALFTVNPIAVRCNINIYTENKREVSEIFTEAFGTVMLVAVGATIVGSIHHLTEPGAYVTKGDEHGYFAFGGSTVLLLFQVRMCTVVSCPFFRVSLTTTTHCRLGGAQSMWPESSPLWLSSPSVFLITRSVPVRKFEPF